ncbi:hypothetical protein ElyMa_000193600 [Elysia marginata]|uniref:Uncharacterized protein n=1 Tax=Elysia marginata TaxID=1093978 RepID=A0AAV4EV30_9GAST|nr:hypothetical protein ElyMa_000193600 [Elysia marginata]
MAVIKTMITIREKNRKKKEKKKKRKKKKNSNNNKNSNDNNKDNNSSCTTNIQITDCLIPFQNLQNLLFYCQLLHIPTDGIERPMIIKKMFSKS